MPPHILIVEDEPGIAETISYALETEGMRATWCATGGEAATALSGNAIDLVILDIGLPDVSGFDLCREIRSSSSVPIIFLTARREEVDRIVGLELGGDDYVVKPFSPRELSARVKAVLRRAPKPVGDTPYSPAEEPFAVDANRRTISFFGQVLDLSRYEYRLLELLIKRPGWVFSRDQIMESVWEEPEASFDRTVDTHVKTLRAKLHAVRPGLDPIRTHRGLGYSLRESL